MSKSSTFQLSSSKTSVWIKILLLCTNSFIMFLRLYSPDCLIAIIRFWTLPGASVSQEVINSSPSDLDSERRQWEHRNGKKNWFSNTFIKPQHSYEARALKNSGGEKALIHIKRQCSPVFGQIANKSAQVNCFLIT